MTHSKWKLQNIIDSSEIHINHLIFKIGRQPDYNLTTESTVISRNHATISILADGLLYVTDNQSTNGTFVNEIKITPMVMHLLNDKDIVGFGVTSDLIKKTGFKGPNFIYKVVKLEDSSSNSSEKKLKIEHTSNSNCNIVTPEVKETSVYTINESYDNLIVISDEDEEDENKCSQIFNISKYIKPDPANDELDPYKEIKAELNNLDYCNINYVPVDLTDEFDHFETTSQLLGVLENSDTVQRDKQIIDLLEDNNTIKPIKQTTTNSTINTNLVSVNDEQLTNKQKPKYEVQAVLQKQEPSEYIKPSITEPHFMRKATNDGKEKKDKVKRKSTGKKQLEPPKKQRRRSSTNSQPLDSSNKQQIHEIRRQKLKEIAEAEKLGKQISTSKCSKGPAKVKVSESRGDFLLKNSKILPTKLNQVLKNEVTHNRSENDNKAGASSLKKNDPKLSTEKYGIERIQDCTVSSALVPKNDKAPIKLFQPYKDNGISSNYTPDSTVNDDKYSTIWKLPSNQKPYNYYNNNPAIDLEEEILTIVQWNVNWLLEQKNLEISPPVNGNKELLKVPSVFDNFENYKIIMYQHIMLELWQYIFQTTFNKEEERLPLKVRLEHVRSAKQITYLDFEYDIPVANKGPVPFRHDDFCLMELRLKESTNVYQYTGFGIIKNVNKQNFGKSIRVTLVIINLNKEIISKSIIVKVVANIANYLRLLRTVKFLKNSPLCQYVLNPEKLISSVAPKSYSIHNSLKLNPLQKEISNEASEFAVNNKPGFYLIKGPPGTGKSSVIISIVLEILYKARKLKKNPLILIAAPSNAAIDALILKLYKARCELAEDKKLIKIVRIGPESSINELVNRFTLRYQTSKTLIIEKNLIKPYSSVEKQMDQESFLRQQLGHQFTYEMKATENRVLLGANLICTTLNSCVSYILNNPARRGKTSYTCCIVDEATQCNEIENLLPIQLGINKFILVGDPQQLPAVVCNKEAQSLGFGKSIFSRMFEIFLNSNQIGYFPFKILREQYRMLPEICDYPNRTFYEGKLKSHPILCNKIEPQLRPYLVFNLCKSENCDRSNYINTAEVTLICNLLETLRLHTNATTNYSIGIITPYKAQKELVAKSIAGIKMNPNVVVMVNTVDSFQGSENDIVIISCVRYNSNFFLSNEKRLNVALTRAKQALYIIGNYTLFKQCRPLYDLREDAKKRKLLIDIKNDPQQISSLRKYILSCN